MKKHLTALIAVCFLLASSLAAYADLLIEPENDFYDRYRDKIVYLGRSFSANGADGFVFVRTEPGSKKNLAKVANGETFFVRYSCLYNGDYWGFIFDHSGWIKLSEMLVLYDYVAFEEDHLDELYLYSGDYAAIKETCSAIAWPWPGADALLWTIEDLNIDNFRVSHAYKDDAGREWGFVTYLYGSRNIWFCLSDPLNRDIPVFNPVPEPGVWVSETEHIDIKLQMKTPENDSSKLIVVIILVAALVIGTAVLIKIFWKPKSEPTSGGEGDE